MFELPSRATGKGYYIFRASVTINNVKYYARDYGKKAFKIWISC